MFLRSTLPQEQKNWRIAFIILSVFIIILMPLISRFYGQTGDEWLQIEYGNDIWDYFFHGSRQALDYTNKNLQHSKQEFYGGLFDFPMTVLHHWLPSVPLFMLRHFFNALSGATMMVFTGLLATRLSRKWMVGVIALLFMIFSPRIFGESMNNPKDIPFACGFIVGTYFLVAFLQDFPERIWSHTIGIMLGWGYAFGVRAAGGILLIAYFVLFAGLYFLLYKDFRERMQADGGKLLKRGILALGIAIVGGYIIGLVCWPWGLQSPISHPIESLQGMTNRTAYLKVLFDGRYYMSDHLPWYYELKWICISNPLIILAGIGLFVVLALKARKQYGLFAVLLLLFGMLFPLLYMINKHSTVYDTWRHVFFVYPFWAMAGALGWDLAGQFIKNKKYAWLPAGIALAGLVPAIVWTVRSHPNQYVYFNELTGGLKGAYGKYDLDYYQNTSLQAARWISAHVKPVPGRKIMVRSNMSGFDQYFARDSAWIASDYGRYNERHARDWDYYVHNGRYMSVAQIESGMWPPQNVVHRIEIDGVPLCVVIQRKSTDGIAASQAYEQKDFAKAAALYAAYVKADSTDEYAWANYGISLASTGQMDAALDALGHATRVDPGNAQFFDVLAQIYGAKGDAAHAQEAHSRALAITGAEEEEAE